MGNRDSVPAFATGFTLGIAFGLVIGLIFAPVPGKKTRELVKDKVTGIPETARDLTADRKKVYAETWKQRKEQPKVSDTYFE